MCGGKKIYKNTISAASSGEFYDCSENICVLYAFFCMQTRDGSDGDDKERNP